MIFFSSSLIVLNLSLICSQYIRSQNEKFQNSLMSALHCGHFTFALPRGKSLGFPGFSRFLSIAYLITLCLKKKNLLFWKKVVENVLNFSCIPKSVRSNMAASSKIHKSYVFVVSAFLTEIKDSLSFALIY